MTGEPTSPEFAIGERVVAAINGTGHGRAGVITARLDGAVSRYVWNGAARYMVRFDGDKGHSGPCVVYYAEPVVAA